MRLIITDSGLGGLSICANLINHLQCTPASLSYDIKYINAVSKPDYGYNSMSSRSVKITTFSDFLTNAGSHYNPDKIFIACNSLSVIYAATNFSKTTSIPVLGIVEYGLKLLLKSYNKLSNAGIIILGTETTINEDTHRELLLQNGISDNHIIPQNCPNLADTISNDFGGEQVRKLVRKYISNARDRFPFQPSVYLIYLGCTHYGYRRNIISEEAADLNMLNQIINPNESAYKQLLKHTNQSFVSKHSGNINVEFVTSYPIPDREIKNLTKFLLPISQETVNALQNYTVSSNLF